MRCIDGSSATYSALSRSSTSRTLLFDLGGDVPNHARRGRSIEVELQIVGFVSSPHFLEEPIFGMVFDSLDAETFFRRSIDVRHSVEVVAKSSLPQERLF